MSDPMSERELGEIRARAEKVTAAPWDTLGGTVVRAILADKGMAVPIFESRAPVDAYVKQRITHKAMCAAYADEVNNATFIAHARTDIPALLAEIDRLRASRELMREAANMLDIYAWENTHADKSGRLYCRVCLKFGPDHEPTCTVSRLRTAGEG